MQSAGLYSHIRYAVFVALEIFGGAFMGFISKLKLYSECFKLAGIDVLKACAAYLSGRLVLEDFPEKSSDFPVGDAYE